TRLPPVGPPHPAAINNPNVYDPHHYAAAVRLGDRIAVFRTGGHLVQCAPPAELLARPADDFVADFLGAERGLKLLSLSTLADLPRQPATTVRADEPTPTGRADWQLVVSAKGEPLGWLDPAAAPSGPAGDAPLLPVRPLRDTDSLLSALNESVASPAGLIARVDDTGVLTGVTAREAVHARAGDAHTAAVAAPLPATAPAGKGSA
ncbi:ABC transporter ATP-binding protein, partial [Streptomyces sp. NPDC059744]